MPIDKYRRHFETCPFAQGVYGGNSSENSSFNWTLWHLWRYMGSRSYSQNYIKFRLQPPRYTSWFLPSLEEYTALKQEDVRLRTCSARWSKDFIDTRELATVGFHFVGHSDQVQCAFCAGAVGNWKEEQLPIDEHRKHFETFTFVRGVDVGNISTKSSTLTGDSDNCER